MLNKRADGACVFLDETQKCRIHAEYGELAKPLACRIFPFSVRPTARGWRASLRFDCPSVTGSVGLRLSANRDWVARLVTELEEDAPRDEKILLTKGLIAQADEIDSTNRRIWDWISDQSLPMSRRVAGFAKLVTTLFAARLANVRGDRFDDLLDILLETIRAEPLEEVGAPSQRQSGMLRQLVLAHAEHVTLGQLRSMGGRALQRVRQLSAARKMLKGTGLAPRVPGVPSMATFEQIGRVERARDDAARIDDLLRRYLVARLEGDSVFGAGYYGWSILDGAAALCLSIACAGWLARYIAAGDKSEFIRFSDAAAALGIVDRAATRLPALGTWTERNRIRYLVEDDGLTKLAWAYRLTT